MNNRDTLIAMMIDQELERREIAALLSIARETIDDWLVPTESPRLKEIPDMAIELLEIKLGLREVDQYVPEASR